MQLGNMQYLQVGKILNLTTNFNHLGKGGGELNPGCKDPWLVQHNETGAIDKLVS